MSVALRKSDGDIFIDPESGRGEEVSGPSKVEQEMFSCYASDFDADRNWGSNLDVEKMTASSFSEFRSRMFNGIYTANELIIQKQSEDLYLDLEREAILEFSTVDVIIDPENASGLFLSIASIGDGSTEVGKSLIFSLRSLGIRHVLPPPYASGLSFFK